MAKNASSKRIIHGFQQLLRSNPTASPASSTLRETLLESDSLGGQSGVLSRLLAARSASLAAGTRSPAISPPGLLNPRRLVAESGAKLPLLGSGARGTGQANGSGLRHRLLHTCTNNCSSAILPSLAGRFAVKLPPLGFGIKGLGRINGSEVRRRLYSAKSAWHGKYGGELGKSVVGKPVSAVKSAVSRYREAVGLQIEAFWKRNYMALVAAGAVFVCIALWRVMFSVASTFVGLSEGMAKYGFLALASAMVAFAGMYLRARFTINPDKVYRMAMTKLNMSPAILEVMGAPLTGTDVRAYVMSGGGPKLKDFKFRLGGKRCFLIFPIRGSERRGLVSVEVKKKKGQNDMKLLAVDIPMLTGPDQRLYLVGDEQEYKVGGGLISELRDPIVKAMAAEKEFDDLDEKEEEEDELREREEAERRQREEEAEALRREEERLHEKEEERNRQEAKNLEKTGS